jgi:hypothetical protein
MSTKNKPSVSFDDFIWGVGGIAKVINRTRRQTQHLIDSGVIEVVRLNPKTIVASRSKLNKRFAAIARSSAADHDTA